MYVHKFKQYIWANQIHLQKFETLVFNDTVQVYTFGVESFTDEWIREQCNLTSQGALGIRRIFSLVDMITNPKFLNCPNIFKIGLFR